MLKYKLKYFSFLYALFVFDFAYGNDLNASEEKDLIDFQTMCKNPAKYSPYMLYSTSINNAFYIGATSTFFSSDLKNALGGELGENINYRLIFNHTVTYFTPTTSLYFGTLGDFLQKSGGSSGESSYKYTRFDMGAHLGLEANPSKYFALFLEAGPALQSRALITTNHFSLQNSQAQDVGFGAYGDIGVRLNILNSIDSAFTFRLGLNIQAGLAQRESIYLNNATQPISMDLNSFAYGPSLELGYSF